MIRTVHDYAKGNYKYVIKNYKTCDNDFDYKFFVLVNCQQMIETILESLIELKFGQSARVHNLRKLMYVYNSEMVKEHYKLLVYLTDCYYDNKCHSECTSEFSEDEFIEIVEESLELYRKLDKEYEKLKGYCNSDMKLTNSFE